MFDVNFLSNPIVAIIARPLIGALIGYITNDIAIRMLFRPHKAKYIAGIRVPFTPGIIPKEKSRIASAIGAAVSENLMNKDVIQRALTSPEMMDKIASSIDAFIESQRESELTLGEFLAENIGEPQFSNLKDQLLDESKSQLSKRLAASNIGEEISEVATKHVLEKFRSGIGKIIPAPTSLSDALVSPIRKLLAKNINDMLQANASSLVSSLIDKHAEETLREPMNVIIANHSRELDKLKKNLLQIYVDIIETRLPRMLDAVNISKIIEDRINEMDVAETESVVLQVMNRELKALVWLGALLGFIMGGINLLF